MQSIGERLKEARERKGVSLREAAEATKIRGDYLQKIEGNKFDFGLTPLYVRSFIRGYAGYLKIPADRLLADYTALGHGEPGGPRPVNREVYGKVDFGAPARAEPRAEPPAAADATAGKPALKPSAPPRSRPATAVLRRLPLDTGGPDALIRQGGLALGGLVLVVLALWGLGSIFSSGKASKSAAPEPHPALTDNSRPIAPDTPAVAQRVPAGQILLTALNPVRVQVWERTANAANPYGKVLLAETTLARGETRPVQSAGKLIIYASVTENLQVDTATQSIKLAEWKARLNGSPYVNFPP